MDANLNEIRQIILSDKSLEQAIETSIHKDPIRLANIISPVIGPSIRITVVDYFEKMMLSFNRAIESSFSIQGLKWRIESIRSGRPFSEVVLLHNLLFRVEDIFVIHQKTGILLIHCSSIEDRKRSGDQVAGMLTAIHDFVGETFSMNEKDQNLSTVRVGETKLLMEKSKDVLLAAAIRGEAPPGFKQQLNDALTNFQQKYSVHLINFKGDVEIFSDAEANFKSCLRQEMKSPEASSQIKQKSKAKYPLIILSFVLLLLLGWWIKGMMQDHKTMIIFQDYLSDLERTEGIVLLNSEQINDQSWVVRILKTNQFKVESPKLPAELKNKVKIISRPFAMYSSASTNPLTEIIIPYFRGTKKINGEIGEQMNLFGKIVKVVEANALKADSNFYVHAFVYDVDKLGMKEMLSDLIGRLETSLAIEGLKNNKIIKYSILDPKESGLHAPYIRFEVLYD